MGADWKSEDPLDNADIAIKRTLFTIYLGFYNCLKIEIIFIIVILVLGFQSLIFSINNLRNTVTATKERKTTTRVVMNKLQKFKAKMMKVQKERGIREAVMEGNKIAETIEALAKKKQRRPSR